MIALWCILSVLAVYRVAYLATTDSGPARVFENIRGWALKRWGSNSWQYEGATCLFCQSVWYSFPAAVVTVLLWPEFQASFIRAAAWACVLWLGYAGAALVLHWLILTMMARVNKA